MPPAAAGGLLRGRERGALARVPVDAGLHDRAPAVPRERAARDAVPARRGPAADRRRDPRRRALREAVLRGPAPGAGGCAGGARRRETGARPPAGLRGLAGHDRAAAGLSAIPQQSPLLLGGEIRDANARSQRGGWITTFAERIYGLERRI